MGPCPSAGKDEQGTAFLGLGHRVLPRRLTTVHRPETRPSATPTDWKRWTPAHNYSGQGVSPAYGRRIRRGRANTACDSAHFLPETMSRVRDAGARRQITARADSGFYTRDIVAACQKTTVRFSMTVRRHRSLRNLIETKPEADCTPIPYWPASD